MDYTGTDQTLTRIEIKMDDINKSDLTLIGAACCTYNLLYCSMPNCIGCAGDVEILCCGHEFCCKPGANMLCCTPKEGSCCQLGLGICMIDCKSPKNCCKASSQCLCLINSCIFPCNDEMPCMLAILGLVCYPTCGCCMKYGAVSPNHK